MKYAVFFFSFLFFATLLSAQEPALVWAKQLGGAGADGPSSIAVDAAGNVYTTGYFRGTADFDPGPGTFNLTAAGDQDIFVSKVNAQGDFLWAKQIGGTSLDIGFSINLDAAGNMYIRGVFSGTVDFDPGPGTFNLTATSGNLPDDFLSKLDAQGNFLWAKHLVGGSIAVDASGNVYTTGGGTSKLDPQGNLLWAMSGTGGSSIALDAAGNIYTMGTFVGTVDFDPGPGTYSLTAIGDADIFLSKLDAQGNFLWARAMGGSDYDYGNAIVVDAAGNVYTTGGFQGTLDFDPGPNTFNLTSAGNKDIFISKLDAQGNFLWARAMGGSDYDYGNAIVVDAAGNVYTTGSFSGAVDFDPGPGVFNLTAPFTTMFISKLDTQGNFLWAEAMGGIGFNQGIDIALDAAGNVYTTGNFLGIWEFDPGPGTFNLTSNGQDIFVLNLSQGACTAPTFTRQVVVNAACGKSDGLILLTPTSGTAPYQYSLNGGATYVSGPAAGYTFENLSPGTYQLRIKDAGGCESAIVQQVLGSGCPLPCTPPTFLGDGTIVKAPTCGQSNGSLYLLPTSGTAPFQYSKDGGQTYVSGPATLFAFTGLSQGVYQLRIKDARGCESEMVSKVVAALNCPITGLPPASTTCTTVPTFLNNGLMVKAATCGRSDGGIYLIPTAGTAPFLYSLNGGQSYFLGPDAGMGFQELPAGTYQLRIRDANGCESAVVQRVVPSGCLTAPTITRKTDAVLSDNSNTEVQVYPNPSTGRFRLQLTGLASDNVQVQVLNSKGQVVEQRRVNISESGAVDFNLSGKAKGLYFVRVVSGKGTKVSKVLIQ